MTYTRREVRKLGEPWNETLLWYSRAVGALSQRPLTDKLSWRYLAAMHDFDLPLWKRLGYYADGEAFPPNDEIEDHYWQQCQHQSWYFLPWHRAYLLSFERIVRATVKSLGGPSDWSLPYWNYSSNQANARMLPAAFTQLTMPGGEKNWLYVEARYGNEVRQASASLVGRLEDNDFVGVDAGPLAAFGGPKTSFSLSGDSEGLIEALPHDFVHVDVGGRGGLMSDPRTAALDPIFWLHHANIDRLWAVWLARSNLNKNPTDPAWLDGPTDRVFAVFDEMGQDMHSHPRDVLDLDALGYQYDDISDPLAGTSRHQTRMRLFNLELPIDFGGIAMPKKSVPEVIGATDRKLSLGSNPTSARIMLSKPAAQKVKRSLTEATLMSLHAREPDRVFLRLENITGDNGAATFDVYVSPPDGSSQEQLAGRFALFGLERASDKNLEHGGGGLTKVVEITDLVDKLHVQGQELPDALDVRLVPTNEVQESDHITVGQVSIVRQE